MSSRILLTDPMRTVAHGAHGNAHERLRAALHEAGHAVAAHLLGVEMRRMTIPSPSCSPQACTEEQPFWATRTIVDHEQKRFVESYLTVACAGRAAELLLYGEANEPSAATDMRIVREILLESPLPFVPAQERKNVESFLASFRERRCTATQELLAPHQGLLYAVARRLIERESVEARDVHALLNRMLVEDA